MFNEEWIFYETSHSKLDTTLGNKLLQFHPPVHQGPMDLAPPSVNTASLQGIFFSFWKKKLFFSTIFKYFWRFRFLHFYVFKNCWFAKGWLIIKYFLFIVSPHYFEQSCKETKKWPYLEPWFRCVVSVCVPLLGFPGIKYQNYDMLIVIFIYLCTFFINWLLWRN